MLGLFKRNLFINYFFLLLFAVVLHFPFFFNWTSEDPGISLPIETSVFPGFLNKHIFQSLLSISLIALQAVIISRYVINNRFSRALSVIPGACFILYASFVLEDLSFHPVLLANLFFILAIGNLYRIYKKFHPVTNIFNAGLFLSIACLIYYPYFLFVVILILGLISLRNTSLFEFIQLVLGFLCGIFLVGVILYANGHLDLLGQMINTNFSVPHLDFSDLKGYLKPGFILLIIIFLIINQNSIIKKKNFDVIRKLQLNYWILFTGFFSIFFIEELRELHLMTISFPVSVLGGLILEKKEKTLIREFIFLIALVLYFILVFKLI